MTAAEMKALLKLQPHPMEGGHFRQTYVSAEKVQLERGERAAGTAIYYLLEDGAFSEMHMLQSDEVFHFYLGDPVEMLQLSPDGGSEVFVLGQDLAAGQHVQLVVPAGVWQGSVWWRAAKRRCWAAQFRRDSIIRIIAAGVMRAWRTNGRRERIGSARLPDGSCS